ncbi:MAG: hypothetical protein EA343_05340 [Nodularia sp. (in: Bacteria)]|nr:MAG: hypothetical protein EA343_05340 [Nodularia sp. (in: cyanobacteria)]
MEQQNFLNQSDIEKLSQLLCLSKKSTNRQALCFRIGLDYTKLPFMNENTESDFFLLLVNYLNGIEAKEALCKLCCDELIPVFTAGKNARFLSNIAEKLDCSRKPNPNDLKDKIPIPSPSSHIFIFLHNTFNELAKNKLIAGGVIIIFCLSGYMFYKQNLLPNNSNTIEQTPSPILDYSSLEKLLSQKDWEGADQETTNIMFSLSNRRSEIRTDDIENFSCQVLDKIDKLWRNASKDHFGFSIQNKIWQQEREQNPFETAVGWSRNSQFIENNPDLKIFSLDAPKGHLPTVITLVDRGYPRSMGEIERKFFTHEANCRLMSYSSSN